MAARQTNRRMYRKAPAILFIAALVVLMTVQAPVGAQQDPTEPPAAPRRILVGANPGQRAEAVNSFEAQGGRTLSFYAEGDFYVVEIPAGRKPAESSQSLRGQKGIRFAEPDYLLRASDVAPTDPMWNDLWGMKKIGMPRAWDTALGGNTGSASLIAGVIDTGVDYNHPDLQAQMWQNPGETGVDPETGQNKASNNVDDDNNLVIDDVYGNDCANNDGNPLDDNGHGTHVSGTIGASANNGVGVAGAAWQVKIMALKFLDAAGSGYTSDAVECLDYGISKGVAFTNNSWGGGGSSQALSDAIGRARSANQLFMAAAGNDARNNDTTPFYPSSYSHDNIISVAATTSTDSLASFSNYGATSVDIAAPGVSILSTLRNNTYGYYNGTSMATPHVAGAAVLVISKKGPLTPYGIIRDTLLSSADPVAALSGKVKTGGRLNAGNALTKISVTAYPNATVFELGSSSSGSAGDLGADDNYYYRVRSTTSGTRISSWYGSFAGVPADASNFKITYKGKNSISASQTVSVRNFATGAWTVLDTRSVSSSEVLLSNLVPPGTPTSYISPYGEVRVRVRASRSSSSFYSYGDLMKVTFDRP